MSFATAPIGMVFSVANGATPKSGEEHLWDGDIPWVTPADLGKNSSAEIEAGSRSITREGLDSCGTQIVPNGSIIVSIRAPIGHTAIATVPLCFNQGCRGLIPSKKVLTKFGYWSIIAAKPALQSEGQGTTFQELGRDKLRSIRISLPDLPTQRAIADFLDRETARIDLLIEKKQRLVALLGEREAALRDRLLQISTDSSIEDSERPWLSGYCGDWKVQRLSYYLRSSPCYGVLKPDNYEGADAVPIIRIKDISNGELQLDDIVTISPEQSQEYSRTILRTGDVVLSVVGTIGKILTVNEIASGMNLTRALARIQLSEGLSADFLTLVVGSLWFTEYVTVTTQGSAQKVLNMEDLRAWRFPVPPKAEQTRVCEMYHEQSASLVATRQRTNTSIDRLREYRSALITTAVTGRIDVAEWSKSGEVDRQLDALGDKISA